MILQGSILYLVHISVLIADGIGYEPLVCAHPTPDAIPRTQAKSLFSYQPFICITNLSFFLVNVYYFQIPTVKKAKG